MAKHRRPQGVQWSARAVPTHRRHLADDIYTWAHQLDTNRQQAIARGVTDQARLDQVGQQIAHERRLAQRAEHAELYWVAPDMTRLALDASHDVPDFRADHLPVPNGLLLLADAPPTVTMPQASNFPFKEVPVWGLWWHPSDGGGETTVQILTRRSALPNPVLPGSGQLQPTFTLHAPWDTAVDFAAMTGQLRDETGAEITDDSLGVMAFLAAVTVMMMTPTIAERQTLDARTGRPSDRAPQARPADLVTTIDLRPLRHVTDDEPGDGGRVYRHRWVVRGHWTHQPHGPGGSLRKLVYRAPYIKGPDGAPLLITEKVMVWRR